MLPAGLLILGCVGLLALCVLALLLLTRCHATCTVQGRPLLQRGSFFPPAGGGHSSAPGELPDTACSKQVGMCARCRCRCWPGSGPGAAVLPRLPHRTKGEALNFGLGLGLGLGACPRNVYLPATLTGPSYLRHSCPPTTGQHSARLTPACCSHQPKPPIPYPTCLQQPRAAGPSCQREGIGAHHVSTRRLSQVGLWLPATRHGSMAGLWCVCVCVSVCVCV